MLVILMSSYRLVAAFGLNSIKNLNPEVIMSCTVVIGTQWGDEGKAKMIDYYSRNADIIVRYQGGANAGHTVVVNGKKHVFHLIPSGILHEGKECVVANGVVVDPIQLLNEFDLLEKEGLNIRDRIFISDAAHLILPYHKEIDAAMEEVRSNKIGTTKRGIGPAYADKCLRTGIRVGDIFDDDFLRERLETALKFKNLQLERCYSRETFNIDEMMDLLIGFRKRVSDMIRNTQYFLHTSFSEGKNILLEGAQGNGLDIDHGTYPYVTSSNPTIGGALMGSGLNYRAISEVVGITKAYVTRVGEGPFPTEEEGKQGDMLREKGGEYGSTTGRPRRCGWFDVELLKHTARINGLTSIALTKLDVLSGQEKVKVAVGYETDGKTLDHFPSSLLHRAEPRYQELEGWAEDISECKTYEDLPSAAKEFVAFIENAINVPVSIVSVGPDRMNTFIK